MHRTIRSLAAFTLFLVSAAAHAVPSAYCKRVSKKPVGASGYEAVTVDANSGRVVDGSTRLSQGSRVQFIFEAKNPFKYNYRFAVTSQPLGTALASDFLSLIPGLNLGTLTATPVPTVAGASLPASNPCNPGADEEWRSAIEEMLKSAQSRSPQVAENLKYVDSANEFIQNTDDDVLSNLEGVCEQAEKLNAWPHAPGSFKADADAFKADVDAIDALITKAMDAHGQQVSPGCQGYVTTQTKKQRDSLQKDVAAYQDAAVKVEDALQKYKASIQQLNDVLSKNLDREDLFFEVRFVSPRDEPTGVRAEIFRRNIRVANAPERSVGVVELELGNSPFSLTAGVVLSAIDNRRIIRQTARVPTEQNPNQVGLRFGYDEDSDVTVAPAVFFNARLSDCPNYNGGVSAGVVTAAAGSTLRIDYVLGTFLSFRDVFFIHAGIHVGKRDALAGGFVVGDEVPADLPDPIPTTQDWKAGALLGFSFRLK